jgi:hypothetical protein
MYDCILEIKFQNTAAVFHMTEIGQVDYLEAEQSHVQA